MKQRIQQHFRTLLDHPAPETLPQPHRGLRTAIDIWPLLLRKIKEDNLPMRASALTYRTIFGLIPMLVLGLIVFKSIVTMPKIEAAVKTQVKSILDIQEPDELADKIIKTAGSGGGAAEVKARRDALVAHAEEIIRIENAIKNSGENDIEKEKSRQAPQILALAKKILELEKNPENTSESAMARRDTVVELAKKIEKVVKNDDDEEFRDKVNSGIQIACKNAGSVELQSVGVVGFIVLVWAAVSLIVAVEKSFNAIYRSPFERGWFWRITIYWTALTLGPLLLAGGVYFGQKFFSMANDVAGDMVGIGPILRFTGSLLSTFTTWILFFLIYKMVPSTKVGLRPAAIGAAVAALAVELLKYLLYLIFIAKGGGISSSKTVLYGAMAALPVALFWAYISWFILLGGLEVAWICQSIAMLRAQAELRRFRHAHELDHAEASLLLPAMVLAGQAFRNGKPVAEAQLCRDLRTPGDVVRPMMERLVKAGFLHDVLGDDGSNEDGYRDWTLSMPPEKIGLDALLAMSPIPHPMLPAAAVMRQSRDAQLAAFKGVVLSDVL